MPAFWQQPIGAALALTLLTAANPAPADEDASGRGEYLVRAGGCFSCHTAAGGQKLAGGRAFRGVGARRTGALNHRRPTRRVHGH